MKRPFTGRVLAGVATLVVLAGAGTAWILTHHAHDSSGAQKDNAARAATEDASLLGCNTGWTCVSHYAQQLGIKVEAPSSTSADRFLDAHHIGQGGLEYAFRLRTGGQVIVFTLPVSARGASGIPGGSRSVVVVQGHRGVWLPNKPQGILVWQQAGLRYRAWFPSGVTQPAAVSMANGWTAT